MRPAQGKMDKSCTISKWNRGP